MKNPLRRDVSIAVLIPALNEEASLPLVLGDLPWDIVDDVLVVNNGSEDRTVAVAQQGGARVIDEPRRGYGQACLTGLADLAGREGGPPDVVVFLDGDYSDYLEMLPMLVEPIVEDRCDMVLGSRLQGKREKGAMPFQSVFGNKLACFLMWLLFGARYTDLGPFRAIRWTSLEKLGMCDDNFGWTVEMQIKAVRQRLRVEEIPVPYRCRIGISKISGTLRGSVAAGYKILYTIGKYGVLARRSKTKSSVSKEQQMV